jgi:hypothetical protein
MVGPLSRRRSFQERQNDELCAIAADGVKVGADLLFRSSDSADAQFNAHGVINLISASVGGDFRCENAILEFAGEDSIIADGITVVGSTFIEEVYANGVLHFTQANLKQGLFIRNVTFDATRTCRSLQTSESDNVSTELGGPACGIYASDAQIGAVFRLQGIGSRRSTGPQRTLVWLFLSGASLTTIEDDRASWNAFDSFEMTGCEYRSILSLSDAELDWRLATLDHQYAELNAEHRFPDIIIGFRRLHRLLHELGPKGGTGKYPPLDGLVQKFKPQPYIQLAKTFRAAGYEAAARAVLVGLERNRTRYTDITFFQIIWRWLLDGVLRYGYSPFRPVVILLFWAAVSAMVFQSAYDRNLLVASSANQIRQSNSSVGAYPRVSFNSSVFAVDSLVPIVDLNQKKNWTVQKLSSAADQPTGNGRKWWELAETVWRTIPDSGPGVLLIFNTFFGWMLTTLFAAGVSGLLRKEA